MANRLLSKVALFNETGSILILRRSKTAPNRPLQLDLPGGVLDEGEEHLDAAIREVKEEIGMTLSPDTLELVYTSTDFYDDQSIIRYLYMAQIPELSEIVLSYEHDEYYWLEFDKAIAKFDHPVWQAGLKYIKEHYPG